MDITDFERIASRLDGVKTRTRGGVLDCRYQGRLVARQLDDSHVVIRMSFEIRELMLRQFPETFSVPKRYARHMMVVADLHHGDEGAIDDALIEAWRLQTAPRDTRPAQPDARPKGGAVPPYDTGRYADVGNLGQVASHTDAARVVERMLDDLRTRPNEWENPTLERFLDALAASLRALPGRYANRGEPLPTQPTWKLLTEVLVMASGYE